MQKVNIYFFETEDNSVNKGHLDVTFRKSGFVTQKARG